MEQVRKQELPLLPERTVLRFAMSLIDRHLEGDDAKSGCSMAPLGFADH